jgi:hypothetical protein
LVVGGGWLMGWAVQVGEWVALGRLGVGSEKNGWGRENKALGWMDEAETFGWFIVVG